MTRKRSFGGGRVAKGIEPWNCNPGAPYLIVALTAS